MYTPAMLHGLGYGMSGTDTDPSDPTRQSSNFRA